LPIGDVIFTQNGPHAIEMLRAVAPFFRARLEGKTSFAAPIPRELSFACRLQMLSMIAVLPAGNVYSHTSFVLVTHVGLRGPCSPP
jgi:hypothetical protein